MWLFLNNAFLSIVDKGGDGDTLLVRARRAGDIERVFPEAEVQIGGGTDYRYRARIDREHVAQALAEAVRSIKYPNFKSAVRDEDRHEAYMEVWSAMFAYQQQEARKRNSK
jgi:hypothetical protein